MPTLFITGEEDVARFPPFIADALVGVMPTAHAEQVAKAGHSTYCARAGGFNQLVDTFLTKVG